MRVLINGATVNIPSSLSEITLQQRIDYQRQHGDELDEQLKGILEMEDEVEKEFALLDFIKEKSLRTASFFSGFTVEQITESDFVEDILSHTAAANRVLFEQEDEMELQREFLWNGEIWNLAAPELKHGDKMKFGEMADAKQIVKDMIGMGANQWEYTKPLCCIYLRKEGEEYQESFLYEGSERQELMKDLPMDIAMQVGFFLLSTQNIWLNTFQFSIRQKSKAGVEIREDILNAGDGSTYLKALQQQRFLTFLEADLTA